MNLQYLSFIKRLVMIGILFILLLQPQGIVFAAANLKVAPITWNIIGLDSNKVTDGPNHFPIGVRVCNDGDAAAMDVTAEFVWDSTNAYIYNRPGTATMLALGDLAQNTCIDAYFEVEVARISNAYDTTRRYHVQVSADGGAVTGSSPTPRELYVEHLVSQSRNAVTDVQLDGVSIPAGGTMSLVVGRTYEIKLVGFTATQGYNQLESFINFPNTIFQILSVESVYSAPSAGYSIDTLYADSCGWDNVVSSPTYRSCVVSDDKAGGDIAITYQVRIISVPGGGFTNPEPLSTLIYDFSGSSYHYNADYGISTRFAYVLDPTAVDVSKSFSPSTVAPGSTSTLNFTLTNLAPVTVNNISFDDDLPLNSGGQMVVATPATYSTSGCGTPNFAPTAGATTLSFSNGTIAPNGTCTVNVSVSVPDTPITGTYLNVSDNVFVGGLDSGHNASADLSIDTNAITPGVGLCGETLASWNFTGATATILTAPYAADESNVSTAVMSWGNGLTVEGDPSTGGVGGGNPPPGVKSYGWLKTDPINTATSPYMQFAIDTSQHSDIQLRFDAQRKSNGPNNDVLYYSTNGTTWNSKSTFASTTSWVNYPSAGTYYHFTGQTNSTGITYFRIYGNGANATSSGNDLSIDNIEFTGCGAPQQPVFIKTFSPNPVVVGGTSTLTFTITNPNTAALNGLAFEDVLPAGITVASNGPITVCGGSLTTTAPDTIAYSGGILAGSSSCEIPVTVIATTPGPHNNISGFISSTEGGTNPNPDGSATASLVAVLSPTIEKNFNPSTILANETSTLSFVLTNPNPSDVLPNVAFTDILPAGMALAAGVTTPQCGGTVTGSAGTDAVGFSGGAIPAGSTCTVTVDVTASGLGEYDNTSGAVTTTISGVVTGTDTATAALTVKAPNPDISILKRVSTGPTGPWTTFMTVTPGTGVYYQFTVENTGDVDLEDVSVSDPTLTGLGLDLSGCAWVSLPRYSDAVTCVAGPTPALAGTNPNTATAHGTYTVGGTDHTAISSAAYIGVSAGVLNLSKQISTSPSGPWSSSIVNVAPGSTVYYQFTVVNASGGTLTSINVTDIDPAVDVSSCIFTDPLLNNGATTCIVPATVSTTSVATHINTATAHGTDTGGTTVNSSPSSADYTPTSPDLTVTKTNDASSVVAQNDTFNWTITVTNSGTASATFSNGQVIMSDALPGLSGYYPQGDLLSTDGAIPPTGSVYCFITGTTLTCAASGAVTLSAGASFSVTFDVTPIVAGDLVNIATVDPGTNVMESDEGNNEGSNTVTVLAAPTIAKTFLKNPIVAGDSSTLRFTITNPNTTQALSDIAFSDTFPAGMILSADVATPQCGGTVTGAAGSDTISLSGGSIAANGNCTVDVSVTVATGGRFDNTSGAISSTNGGTGNTAIDTLWAFDSRPGKEIVATSEASTGFVVSTERVTIGEMVRYRIWAQLPEGTLTNVQLIDDIPNGLRFLDDDTARFALVSNGGGITSSTLICANDTGSAVDIASLSSSDVDCALTSGSINDSADADVVFGSGESVTFSLGDLTNADTDSDLEYVAIEFNALVLNVNDTVTINQGVNNDPSSATAGQSNTNFRANSVALFVDGSQIGVDSPNATVSIAEPAITEITKSVSAGPYQPGDAITFTLEFSNSATGNNATTAFDITLTDTLDPNLTLGVVNISSTQGTSGVDSCVGGTTFNANSFVSSQNVTVEISCLDAGQTVTVEINATIDVATADGTTLSNTSGLAYTSLPGAQGSCGTAPFVCTGLGTGGSQTGERKGSEGTGSDSAVLNNYAVTSNTVNITVTNTNLLPNAVNDSTSTLRNTPVTTPNVLTNDDMGDMPTTITSFDATSANGGTVTDNGDGTFNYDPPTGFTGTDTFTYTITDNNGDTSTATVTITVDSADFTITKTVTGVDTTGNNLLDHPGELIEYQIEVVNTGTIELTGVAVSDTLLQGANGTFSGPTESLSTNNVLNVGETWNYTGTYTLQQSDFDNYGGGDGDIDNTATANTNETAPQTSSASVDLNDQPGINTNKTLTNVTIDSPKIIRLTYSILVENTGNVPLNNVQVVDDLATTFSAADSFTIESVISSSILTTNPGFDGDTDGGAHPTHVNLLAGTDTLNPAQTGTITLVVLVDTGVKAQTYRNTAVASGKPPDNDPVSDDDYADGPAFVDPAVTKAVSPDQAAVGDQVTYTIKIFNNGTQPAADVVVTDTFPANLDLVADSVTVNPPVNASNPPDYITITAPRTVTVRLGTLGIEDVYVITVQAIVNSLGQPPIQNSVQLSTTSPTPWAGNLSANDRSTASLNLTNDPGVRSLPETGFAPGKVTALPLQPANLAYADLGEVWLEIPSQRVKTSIVGVPRSAGAWDVAWLWEQAGWLQGTAFPSWQGNSVLTGHVYLPDGKPGPFVKLNKLRWGDSIIVHAFGQRYTYQVRLNRSVTPDDLSALEHADSTTLTLITCRGYDERSDTYNYRVFIRAVLTKVEADQ